MLARLFTAVAASSLVFGCASTHLPVVQAQAAPPRDRHVYRLDFVVASNDPGRPPENSAYTLNLEEWDSGEIRMGSNVALSPSAASSPRMDVGLKLRGSIRPAGDDLVFHGALEMSSREDTTIQKISADGDAVLTGGRSALVASLEDPLSHRHYQVTAAATKLR